MEFVPTGIKPKGVVPDDAPVLVEWVTVSEAAQLMGLTRQMVHRMAQAGYFRSLHRLGAEDDRRPIYVLRRSEVLAEAARRSDGVARLADRAAALKHALEGDLVEGI